MKLNLIKFVLLSIFTTQCIFSQPIKVDHSRYNVRDYINWSKTAGFDGIYPFVSEFTFRKIADHVIEPLVEEFDPLVVQPGDVLWVGVWYLDWFVENIHRRIQHPYILITCDVGGALPHSPNNIAENVLLHDPKVAAWFAKNMLFTNSEKLFQIPMGQVVNLWMHGFDYNTFKKLYNDSPFSKEYLVYMNHCVRKHAYREKIIDLFKDAPYCFYRKSPINREQFWEEISRAKFVISPLGLEVDCVRTWECLSLKTFPIVEHSYLDPLYTELPVLLVHNWEEINEQFLNEKYVEFQEAEFNYAKAEMDYWIELIKKKQTTIQKGELDFATIENNNFSKEAIKTFHTILKKFGKEQYPIFYRGTLTYLRPYQISQAIPRLPQIILHDIWSNPNYLSHYSGNFKLKNNKVISNRKSKARNKKTKYSFFFDLTNFRHALLKNESSLSDFHHSLEKDLTGYYAQLEKGNLFFGNMVEDRYVKSVLERMQQNLNIRIQYLNDFWFCIKD